MINIITNLSLCFFICDDCSKSSFINFQTKIYRMRGFDRMKNEGNSWQFLMQICVSILHRKHFSSEAWMKKEWKQLGKTRNNCVNHIINMNIFWSSLDCSDFVLVEKIIVGGGNFLKKNSKTLHTFYLGETLTKQATRICGP